MRGLYLQGYAGPIVCPSLYDPERAHGSGHVHHHSATRRRKNGEIDVLWCQFTSWSTWNYGQYLCMSYHAQIPWTSM